MSKALDVFSAFEKNGAKALEIIRKKAYTPHLEKILRTWGITDACKMIGRSLQRLRDAEKEGKIPIPEIDKDTGKRVYGLELINKLRDHFGTRPSKLENSDPSIIAFTNFKGGVTKTTTAVNTAQGFALKGYRVLFIDGDSQGSATQCFGFIPDEEIAENETLLPVLRRQTKDLSSVIRKTHWDGLDLIPANLSLYNAEFELPVESIRNKGLKGSLEFYNILKEALFSVQDKYDIVVIDCPPSMGMISINAIYAANALVIPLPPFMLDFCSTIQFFGMLHDVLSRFPDKEYSFIRILITKFERSETTIALTNIIRQLYADYVLTSMMPLSEAIKKAGTEMLSIYEIDKYAGSKKTLDRVMQAAEEVISELEDLIRKFWELNLTMKQHSQVGVV